MSVTMLAMLRGFRVADGIFLHYPVLNVDPMSFVPSHLLALDEELLNPAFIAFALGCFARKGGNPEKSCLMSPLLAPDSIIRRLPPCKFMVAEVDSLRDHSFSMAIRILRLGGRCKVILMKDFIHGFNSMDTNIVGIEEYRRGTNLTIEHFVKLFNHIKWIREEQQFNLSQRAYNAASSQQ